MRAKFSWGGDECSGVLKMFDLFYTCTEKVTLKKTIITIVIVYLARDHCLKTGKPLGPQPQVASTGYQLY